jgi:hypothetical protein
LEHQRVLALELYAKPFLKPQRKCEPEGISTPLDYPHYGIGIREIEITVRTGNYIEQASKFIVDQKGVYATDLVEVFPG